MYHKTRLTKKLPKYKKNNKMIREKIIAFLEELNLSTRKLTQIMNIRYNTVSEYLNGNKEASSETIDKILIALNVRLVREESICEKLIRLAHEASAKKSILNILIKKAEEIVSFEADDKKHILCGFCICKGLTKGIYETIRFVDLFIVFQDEDREKARTVVEFERKFEKWMAD